MKVAMPYSFQKGRNYALASVQSQIYMTLLATEPPSH